jgi:hypothetical protein
VLAALRKYFLFHYIFPEKTSGSDYGGLKIKKLLFLASLVALVMFFVAPATSVNASQSSEDNVPDDITFTFEIDFADLLGEADFSSNGERAMPRFGTLSGSRLISFTGQSLPPGGVTATLDYTVTGDPMTNNVAAVNSVRMRDWNIHHTFSGIHNLGIPTFVISGPSVTFTVHVEARIIADRSPWVKLTGVTTVMPSALPFSLGVDQ